MALVEVNDLWVTFKSDGKDVPAVKGASFNIEKGETLALVGESGSGKSVTALSILQLLPYPLARHPEGSIKIDGTEVVGRPQKEMRKFRGNSVSMIFQEPMTSLNPLHTIEKQINETLLVHKGMSKKAASARVRELLELVGLDAIDERLNAYPHQLSGGQRQRVMIAMALANEPELLIADEPTTALDVTIQAQILELLADLQKRLGMAILLITHDLGIVRKMAKNVCVMTDGEIVEANTAEEIFLRPRHEYTRMLLDAEPKGLPIRKNAAVPDITSCRNLKVYFPIKKGLLRRTVDHVRAVDDITLHVKQGHTVGIVGESGSGKSTLGFALLRLISSEGEIMFDGKAIQDKRWSELRSLRSQMQIVFQDPYSSLSPRLSVGQIIEEGLIVHEGRGSRLERRDRISDVLKEVGIPPEAQDRYPHEFSGGQRQRIAIARALILKPKFIVLDEPTSALDMSVQAQIVNLLRDLQNRHNLTYLFISHDLKVVRAMADSVIVMQRGKIVEQGPATEIFDNPATDYTKALMKAAFDLEAATPGVVSS
ncbi:MAG: microcin ABC transporter ATP-binding protein [Sneathiella sp.]|uniref:ABC transporter ATP-binding protein n=1 Tax=Sneathiella sp. TaxID=1964365 RepID=UPI000C484F42|nr:ABC transporter ATP-binding protein [Sneathiella sp.]MAL78897.1 microcin ABC transporter ATP-binding protein [Sneathiella sp.]